jgi:hypothetical protein
MYFYYISEPVVKHSSFKTDIEFENMDFLELTSSEEHLLFKTVNNNKSWVFIWIKSINGNEYGVH